MLIRSKLFYLFSITGLVVGFDQLTKLYVHTNFQLHESRIIIENFFNLTYVRNFGAAFGILSQTPASFREMFFILMPLFACGLILYILNYLQSSQRAQAISLSFIFGGAIGNFIDRYRFHYVIDFIDFHYYGRQTWPAFNIADVAIVCGVASLVYFMLKEKKQGVEP